MPINCEQLWYRRWIWCRFIRWGHSRNNLRAAQMDPSHWRPMTKIVIAIIALYNHVWQLTWVRPLLPLTFPRAVHIRYYLPTARFSSSLREMKFGTKIKVCDYLDPGLVWYLAWISHGRMICTANGGLFISIITCWKGSLRYVISGCRNTCWYRHSSYLFSHELLVMAGLQKMNRNSRLCLRRNWTKSMIFRKPRFVLFPDATNQFSL